MAALVSYNGANFPQGDPIVSMARSYLDSGGTPVVAIDKVTLEGTIDKCEEGDIATVETMFESDFKTLIILVNASRTARSLNSARSSSVSLCVFILTSPYPVSYLLFLRMSRLFVNYF